MADTKQSADTPTNGARAPQAPRPSVGQRVLDALRGPMVSNPNASGTQRGAMGRYFRNMILFFVLAEALTFGMEYANVQFKLHLEQPIPGVSWLSWMLLINLVIIAGVFLGLRSMGFFPTDMFSPQSNGTARGSSSSSVAGGSSRGSGKVEIPGIGKARTRAERRAAQIAAEQAAAAAAAKAKGKKAVTAPAKTVATPSDMATTDEHDDAYERAKAAQRLRKRRALR